MDSKKEEVISELKSLSKKFNRRPTKRDSARLYYLSRKYFGTWNNIMDKAGYSIKKFQKVSAPDMGSNLLFYFLGLLITDGHVQKDRSGLRYRIMLFTSNPDEKELIINIIQKLFSYKPYVRVKMYGFNKKESYEIMINSKYLYNLILTDVGIPCGAKSLTIQIPDFIKKAKSEQIFNFIRGVIDGDGSIIKTDKSNILKIPSGSEKFIRDLNVLLIKLGFNDWKVRKERDRLWVLKLNRKEEIKRLYFLIYKEANGAFYPRKEKIWKQYI